MDNLVRRFDDFETSPAVFKARDWAKLDEPWQCFEIYLGRENASIARNHIYTSQPLTKAVLSKCRKHVIYFAKKRFESENFEIRVVRGDLVGFHPITTFITTKYQERRLG